MQRRIVFELLPDQRQQALRTVNVNRPHDSIHDEDYGQVQVNRDLNSEYKVMENGLPSAGRARIRTADSLKWDADEP